MLTLFHTTSPLFCSSPLPKWKLFNVFRAIFFFWCLYWQNLLNVSSVNTLKIPTLTTLWAALWQLNNQDKHLLYCANTTCAIQKFLKVSSSASASSFTLNFALFKTCLERICSAFFYKHTHAHNSTNNNKLHIFLVINSLWIFILVFRECLTGVGERTLILFRWCKYLAASIWKSWTMINFSNTLSNQSKTIIWKPKFMDVKS